MHKRSKKVKHRTIDLRRIAREEDDDDDFDEVVPSTQAPQPQVIVVTPSSKSSGTKKKRPGRKKDVPKIPAFHEAVISCTKSYILFQEKLAQLQKTQASLTPALPKASSSSTAASAKASRDSSSDDDTDDVTSYEDTDDVIGTASADVEDSLPSYDSAASGEDAYLASLQAVKQILEESSKVVNEKDPCSGRRPLHYAGSGELVKMLVDAGAVADTVDDAGCTALHVMAENGLYNAARVLIDLCRKAFDEKRMKEFVDMKSTSEGESALHLAARIGNLQICSFLISAHADLNM